MKTQTTARTILDQLRWDTNGGTRLGALACVGARDFTDCGDALRFRITISRATRHWIYVRLMPDDTYTVELIKQFRAPSHRVETLKSVEGVYCDQLCETVYRLGTPN